LDKWVPTAWHTYGYYGTSEGSARGSYYGVSGIPQLWVDGIIQHRGAYTNNEQMYNWYMGTFNTRTVIPSPLTIDFVRKGYGGGKACVTVKLTLEQGISAGHVCHLVLWENNLSYSGRNYAYVERRADTKAVTITNANESQEISATFTLDGGWNTANLGVSVYVQDPSGKEIKQARATTLEAALSVKPASLGRVKALYK
jgi:hypothetical protein